MKCKQSGFSSLALILLVAIVAASGLIGWQVYETKLGMRQSDISTAALTGTVTEGPIAPICRPDVSCERSITNHTIEVLSTSGNIVATSKTDGTGRYSFALQPGHYKLVLVPQVGLSVGASGQVDVKAGQNTYNLSVDTGLR